ncbi:MAG: DUF2817 domain-containing protein [Bdellovibrionaceae bacterium]|nr:DUF2817 domain-containing protein [Pseudobdellovibrionaceae bacterium]
MPQFSELSDIQRILELIGDRARVEILAEIRDGDWVYPIHKISFGSPSLETPVLGLVGGIHGLERIGAQVCIALLHSFATLSLWDRSTQQFLEKVRVFFVPMVNPVGVHKLRRSNPRGVDLMRNAPVDATGKVPTLLGGHRLSSWLPWYRGSRKEMEAETRALHRAIRQEVGQSPVAITVDFHSGFGWQDQIWFPYAKSRFPFPQLAELYALMRLFEGTYPHHFYKIEPQAYLTHGDLWDFFFDEYKQNKPDGVYIPLTLEMGSWTWLRKDPTRIFRAEGPFNPGALHRHKRVLRRHLTFFEFLKKSLLSPESWAFLNDEQKNKNLLAARERWYG